MQGPVKANNIGLIWEVKRGFSEKAKFKMRPAKGVSLVKRTGKNKQTDQDT